MLIQCSPHLVIPRTALVLWSSGGCVFKHRDWTSDHSTARAQPLWGRSCDNYKRTELCKKINENAPESQAASHRLPKTKANFFKILGVTARVTSAAQNTCTFLQNAPRPSPPHIACQKCKKRTIGNAPAPQLASHRLPKTKANVFKMYRVAARVRACASIPYALTLGNVSKLMLEAMLTGFE